MRQNTPVTPVLENGRRIEKPTCVVVTINQPQVEHRVRIKDFENWLGSAGRSPAEMALISRLRDIIGRSGRSRLGCCVQRALLENLLAP